MLTITPRGNIQQDTGFCVGFEPTIISWREKNYPEKNLLYCVFLTFYKYYIIIFIIFQIKRILKSRRVVIFQPHAYATPTSQNSTSRISGVGFFTLIQGISTATYLTLPRLPRQPIRPEPFQYSLIGDPDGT